MSGLVGAQCDVTPVIHHSKTMDLDAVQQIGCTSVLHGARITRKDIQLGTKKNPVHQYSGQSIARQNCNISTIKVNSGEKCCCYSVYIAHILQIYCTKKPLCNLLPGVVGLRPWLWLWLPIIFLLWAPTVSGAKPLRGI